MRFLNKSVLITGGTSGLGEATAKAFAIEGASVSFCGLIDSEGKRVENDIKSNGGQARYYQCDVRDDAAVKNFVGTVADAAGSIDIAFNNAGISHASARFADLDLANVEDVWQTNVMGIWHAMRHEITHMLENGSGAIINTSSILSKSGAEWMTAYGMSKHAVVGLTKSAALDYADQGIRINSISPGPILTPMYERALEDIGGDMTKFAGGVPKTGPASPEDVAKTVLYLASDDAPYMTGTNLVVDGGVSSA